MSGKRVATTWRNRAMVDRQGGKHRHSHSIENALNICCLETLLCCCTPNRITSVACVRQNLVVHQLLHTCRRFSCIDTVTGESTTIHSAAATIDEKPLATESERARITYRFTRNRIRRDLQTFARHRLTPAQIPKKKKQQT